MNDNRVKLLVFIIIILLMIPLITMRFTNEVNWTLSDFIIAGTLLLVTGLMCILIRKKVRIAICIALLITLALIWAELAVGIFGTTLSGQ